MLYRLGRIVEEFIDEADDGLEKLNSDGVTREEGDSGEIGLPVLVGGCFKEEGGWRGEWMESRPPGEGWPPGD